MRGRCGPARGGAGDDLTAAGVASRRLGAQGPPERFTAQAAADEVAAAGHDLMGAAGLATSSRGHVTKGAHTMPWTDAEDEQLARLDARSPAPLRRARSP